MKEKIISLLAISILSLTSCSSKRTNIIISGHYRGVDEKTRSVACDLLIGQISENDYLTLKGKNVIQDAINNNYFSLRFTVSFPESDTRQIDFLNFKDAFGGATGTPISYKDDNGCWLTPQTSLNNVILPYEKCYYAIHINIDDLELYAYVYADASYSVT